MRAVSTRKELDSGYVVIARLDDGNPRQQRFMDESEALPQVQRHVDRESLSRLSRTGLYDEIVIERIDTDGARPAVHALFRVNGKRHPVPELTHASLLTSATTPTTCRPGSSTCIANRGEPVHAANSEAAAAVPLQHATSRADVRQSLT
jgi:hypothetical protein